MKKKLVAGYVCLWIAAAAQQAAFEVASIKPSNYVGGPLRVTARVDADGISFSNVTPRLCIQRAYGLKPYQVAGPAWIDTERYVIVAKAAGAIPEAQILEMVQSLLADRFRLTFHREEREMGVYAVVVGRNGPKLKEATGDGTTRIDGDGDGVSFERVDMTTFAGALGRSLDRPLIDATGLKGVYSFKLAWAENDRRRDDRPAPDLPSIFTAMPEQLGLRLEPRKAPVEVLVVDHIEKPSPN